MLRRVAAAAALFALVVAPVLAIVFAVTHLVLLLVTVVALVVMSAAGWLAITRRGATRLAGAIVAALAALTVVAAFFVVLPSTRALRDVVLIAVLLVVALLLGRFALSPRRVALPTAATMRRTAGHPVVFMNPKSGGGKVGRFNLVEEARRRGIEAILLERGDDLRTLVLAAIARGADALGVAGGDGSQAIVASIAIEHGLPFVCIPAGTRNHLALDLGVDRNDVVGSLDAFAEGPEHRVDVGLVDDRVFVNNVSFGVYGEIVQSDEYRDAKVQTAAAMLPDLIGPEATAAELRFRGPDGSPRSTRDLVLVSNNPYELSGIGGFGKRPRLDTGRLGVVSVAVADAADAARFTALQLAGRARDFPGCAMWATEEFEVDADGPVPAGIDGESVRLDPPIRFRMRPGALRVWLAPSAPGANPRAPDVRLDGATFAALWDLVRGGAPDGTNGHAAAGATDADGARQAPS
ncbi:MAG TPA: diacylglycerol kinase family protein [Acidimicrobiia bacterium]|jgi:diacylglycerol kinase family enzyme